MQKIRIAALHEMGWADTCAPKLLWLGLFLDAGLRCRPQASKCGSASAGQQVRASECGLLGRNAQALRTGCADASAVLSEPAPSVAPSEASMLFHGTCAMRSDSDFSSSSIREPISSIRTAGSWAGPDVSADAQTRGPGAFGSSSAGSERGNEEPSPHGGVGSSMATRTLTDNLVAHSLELILLYTPWAFAHRQGTRSGRRSGRAGMRASAASESSGLRKAHSSEARGRWGMSTDHLSQQLLHHLSQILHALLAAGRICHLSRSCACDESNNTC